MPEESEEKKRTRRKKERQRPRSELGGVFGLISLIVIVLFLLFINHSGGMVAGVNTKREAQVKTDPGVKMTKEMQDTVQERLEKVKEQVANLSATDLKTSSPQIEKVMQDLESLKQYPKNQVKDACRNICDGL